MSPDLLGQVSINLNNRQSLCPMGFNSDQHLPRHRHRYRASPPPPLPSRMNKESRAFSSHDITWQCLVTGVLWSRLRPVAKQNDAIIFLSTLLSIQSLPQTHTVLSGVEVPVLVIENCAFFARESPRYLYSWGTTQRELKRCSNCKLGTSKNKARRP